jgi:hypothetical protein
LRLKPSRKRITFMTCTVYGKKRAATTGGLRYSKR